MHSSRELCPIVFYKVDHSQGECKGAFKNRSNVGIWRMGSRPRGRRPPGLFQYFLHSGTVRLCSPILSYTARASPSVGFTFGMTFTTLLNNAPLPSSTTSVTKLVPIA